MGVLLVVGTEKGAFLIRSDRARERWSIEGPVFKGWKVTTAMRDARGRYFLGVASRVYGPTIQMSDDLAKWVQGGMVIAELIGRKEGNRLLIEGKEFKL